jgi:hypothetical protein
MPAGPARRIDPDVATRRPRHALPSFPAHTNRNEEGAMLLALRRVVEWAFIVGGISFAIGFFGPMIVAPGANQGPLLGIFVTGPLGLVLGFGIGIFRELYGWTARPIEVFERTGLLSLDRTLIARWSAGGACAVLLVYGVLGMQRGEGRGAAAALVVAAALGWYAATGQAPLWFRR